MDMGQKKTLSEELNQSYLLARQALTEQMENGKILVICPKCKTNPKIMMQGNNDRRVIECECRYVSDVEILF